MIKIVIIGAGGNSKVIIDILLSRIQHLKDDIKIIGILDDNVNKKDFQGYHVLGAIRKITEMNDDEDLFFINGIGDNSTRKRIFEQYPEIRYYTAVHPTAVLGSNISIEDGTVIMPGVIINANSHIGRQAIINTGAVIEHDNVIGDFAHIASGVTTAGNVRVGECSMLGTGTKVIQGITIGERTVIGAGAVVVRDIPDRCVAVGVPAKVR